MQNIDNYQNINIISNLNEVISKIHEDSSQNEQIKFRVNNFDYHKKFKQLESKFDKMMIKK